MLTYLLALVNPESVGQQVLEVTFLTSVNRALLWPALISWLNFSSLLSPADCPRLLTVSFSLLWNLPFIVFFQSRGRSRAQARCLGFAPKQIKGSADWHPPTPTQWMPNIVSHIYAHLHEYDVTLSQLLIQRVRIQNFHFPRRVFIASLESKFALLYTHSWGQNNRLIIIEKC